MPGGDGAAHDDAAHGDAAHGDAAHGDAVRCTSYAAGVLETLHHAADAAAVGGSTDARQVVGVLEVVDAVLDVHRTQLLPGSPPVGFCRADAERWPCRTVTAIIRAVLAVWPPPAAPHQRPADNVGEVDDTVRLPPVPHPPAPGSGYR